MQLFNIIGVMRNKPKLFQSNQIFINFKEPQKNKKNRLRHKSVFF
jgi:hypothetical protein